MQKFNELSQRERVLVVFSLVIVIIFIQYYLLLNPIKTSQKILQTNLANARVELPLLRQQLEKFQLYQSMRQDQLDKFYQQSNKLDQQWLKIRKELQTPKQAIALLKHVVSKQQGVRLNSFQNLPATRILAPAIEKEGQQQVFLHGMQMELGGDYASLTKLIWKLEQLPKYILWGELKLSLAKQSDADLTMTIYTLGSQSDWLVL